MTNFLFVLLQFVVIRFLYLQSVVSFETERG